MSPHYEDEGYWGEAVPPPARAPKRKRAVMISARFSTEEAKALHDEAARRGESMSRFVRDAALEAIGRTIVTVNYR